MIVEALRSQPFYEKLARRQAGFEFALAHVERVAAAAPREYRSIIETGCAREVDNWAGDGQSTRIWSWAIDVFRQREISVGAYSVDINEEAVAYARPAAPNVKVAHYDSVCWLQEISASVAVERCALLYLDSMDYGREGSAEHHLHELATVWARLPHDCLVMVDDRHGDDAGKHVRIEAFMRSMGRKPVYVDYQIAWLRGGDE